MGKRKRLNDEREAQQYEPDFTRRKTLNGEIEMLIQETDDSVHKNTADRRINNASRRKLRFADNENYALPTNQRKAAKKAQEYQDHLKDHALFFQSLTRKENVTSDKLTQLEKPIMQKGDVNPDPEDVIHVRVRGLHKKVSEEEFRRMLKSVPFNNLRMNVGKQNMTNFVVIGEDNFKECTKLLHQKKIYGKKLQVWKRKVDTSFSNTSRYIYVGNLPPSVNAGLIGGHMLKCGKIRHVTMVPGKACCFIRFKHRSSVKKAIEMHNTLFNGYFIRITEEKNINDLALDKFNENQASFDAFDEEGEDE